jgi:hypothetical protein
MAILSFAAKQHSGGGFSVAGNKLALHFLVAYVRERCAISDYGFSRSVIDPNTPVERALPPEVHHLLGYGCIGYSIYVVMIQAIGVLIATCTL